MNVMTKFRLLMSRFKIPKGYHKTLEKMMTTTVWGIYNFDEDGVLIATTKRNSTDDPIRATVRGEALIDRYPRGVAVTTDGATILTDESMSDGLVEVVKFIDSWNKEIYASRYEKARRNGVNREQHKSDNSTD